MAVTLNRKSENIWEIPITTRQDMKVPALVFTSEDMLQQVHSDRSLEQLINVATLPGIQKYAIVMPDVHEGYGFPIGAVAAIDIENGIISPGGIGYDINCGVRLLKTNLNVNEIQSQIKSLTNELNKLIPSGVGKSGFYKLTNSELDGVLNTGVKWAVNQGYAYEEDLEMIESGGSLNSADADKVSNTAKGRGYDQLGTMGAGNHFVEIDRIEKILNVEIAQVYGLFEGQIVFQIHTGSRGLGHQVATDYIKLMLQYSKDNNIELPDRELSYAPMQSEVGKNYFSAMSAAANFAWTNRQLITYAVRKAWKNIFGNTGGNIDILYDVAHNIAKVEEHDIDGTKRKVIVHRKGATRAFPPNHPEVPLKYRSVGQPVLIPGSMGTASYILSGSEGSMIYSFGSTCHGAGRTMSRSKARKNIEGKELLKELNKKGIEIAAGSLKGLSEEAPTAYKNIDSVVNVVDKVGIAKIIARLKPVAVIKG